MKVSEDKSSTGRPGVRVSSSNPMFGLSASVSALPSRCSCGFSLINVSTTPGLSIGKLGNGETAASWCEMLGIVVLSCDSGLRSRFLNPFSMPFSRLRGSKILFLIALIFNLSDFFFISGLTFFNATVTLGGNVKELSLLVGLEIFMI